MGPRPCSLISGLVLSCVACRPPEAQSVAPDVPALETSASSEAEAKEQPSPPVRHESGDDDGEGGGFVVTLESRCRDTWKAMLVQGAGRDGEPRPSTTGWEPGGFEIRNASSRALRMRPGDALLLTNPHGGIMELSFDKLTSGYGARVEVTPECSGVTRTVVRMPRGMTASP